MDKFDFSGWATKNDLKCADDRIIKKDAFKHNHGKIVPLVWNHQHNDPTNVLGHALLENRDEGVYAYCTFNETENGQNAKMLVEHGDIVSLSIYANKLKQQGSNVLHGEIRELSLVLAGANPGALIESIISHGDNSDEEAYIFTGESIELSHADEDKKEEAEEETKKETKSEDDETIGEIFDTLNEKQKNAVYSIVDYLVGDENEKSKSDDKEKSNENDDESKGGNEEMKQNVFEKDNATENNVLSHSVQAEIISLAKNSSVGSLHAAMKIYAEKNSLAHGFTDQDIQTLFPEYKDVKPGAPELVTDDQEWVNAVIKKMHKSPISRIRTRQADVRGAAISAKGYKKGAEKSLTGNMKLMSRTTDPQTIYIKDSLHRDDIIDITDFDVVEYNYGVMKQKLYEKIATAVMIGDGLEDGEADKISETHIRSIWNDDELYTIHKDVDIEAARTELQGSNTSANFGENYIYAEAIITAALYAREQYKGNGNLDFWCTPHLLNVMLLARDLNGRRIYDSKADLAKALNVNAIYTAEQFEGKTRTTADGKTKKLLGLFCNLGDYYAGSTKGGQITTFNQFDIDFNKEKYLIETRMSGALTKIKSAIALEEDVTE